MSDAKRSEAPLPRETHMRLDPREAERLRSLCETAQHHPDRPSVPVRPEVLLCLLSNVSSAPALPEGYEIRAIRTEEWERETGHLHARAQQAEADRDALRGALREALPYVESAAAETLCYGAFPGGDPRQFTPDPDESTEEEREAHREACARWDAAATLLDGESPAHQWEGDRHVAYAKYGHGTYLYRDPHASALLTAIRALLDAAERGTP